MSAKIETGKPWWVVDEFVSALEKNKTGREMVSIHVDGKADTKDGFRRLVEFLDWVEPLGWSLHGLPIFDSNKGLVTRNASGGEYWITFWISME